MTTFQTIISLPFTVVALAPLAPIFALMFAAKGLHQIKQRLAQPQPGPAKPVHSWDLETVVYFPAGV